MIISFAILILFLAINFLLPFWKWRPLTVKTQVSEKDLGFFVKKYIRRTFILDTWDRLIEVAVINIYQHGLEIRRSRSIIQINEPIRFTWQQIETFKFNNRKGVFGRLELKVLNHQMVIKGVLAGMLYKRILTKKKE